MKTVNSLLSEINSILGVEVVESQEEISIEQPVAPTILSVAQKVFTEMSQLDRDTNGFILESFIDLDWYGIAQIASFGSVPKDKLNILSSKLAESTAAFRDSWKEAGELPKGAARGGMILAGRLSHDPEIISTTIDLAVEMLKHSSPLISEEVSDKYPDAAKYCPGDDVTVAKKAADDTKSYLSPHTYTDKPDKSKVIMTTQQMSTPEERSKEKTRGKKEVEDQIKKLEVEAAKLNKTSVEAFPGLSRDLARDLARFT
jgi:hypothetical protein